MNPVQFRNVTDYVSGGDISADVTGGTIDAAQFRQVSMVAVNTGTNSPAGNIFIQSTPKPLYNPRIPSFFTTCFAQSLQFLYIGMSYSPFNCILRRKRSLG